VIRLDAETQGLRQANAAYSEFMATIKAGVGIDIGGRIVQSLYEVTAALKSSARAGVEFRSRIEDLVVSYRTLLGSTELARMRIADLAQFAAKTPFELPGIGKANKILETLTKGALSGRDGMRLVGDAAAMADAPIEEVAMHVGRLYDALQSGRPMGHAALRLQELGLISGETRNEIEKLQAIGAKGPEVWGVAEKALRRYAGEMEERSKTFSGRLSTLKDAWHAAMGEMMAGAMGAGGEGFKSLTEQLEKPETIQALREMGVKIRQLVVDLGKLAEWAVQHGPAIANTIVSIGKAFALWKISNIVTGGLAQLGGMAGRQLAAGAASVAAGGTVAGAATAAAPKVGVGGRVGRLGAAALVTGALGASNVGETKRSGMEVAGNIAMGAGIGAATGGVPGAVIGTVISATTEIWNYVKATKAEEIELQKIDGLLKKVSGEYGKLVKNIDSVAKKTETVAGFDAAIANAQKEYEMAGDSPMAAYYAQEIVELKKFRAAAAAVDEGMLADKEKAAAEKRAQKEAALNARVNAKTLDKMNTEIAADKSAFQEKFMGAERPDQINMARQYIADLRKEQAANDPAKSMGEDPEEFKEKAARYKALYSEITSWEQRLANLQKAEVRETAQATAQARKATLRDLQGQSYNELLSGASVDSRVGLLSSRARQMIDGNAAAAGKGPDAATLEKIRAGIDKLVELNKQKEPDDSGMWAD
jgi:hypothetical protein